MSDFEYTKIGDMFQLMDGATPRFQTETVAVAFSSAPDGSDAVVHKHGRPDLVMAWVQIATERFRAVGDADSANELQVIESAQWPIEELNKIVSCSGYLERFLKTQAQTCQDAVAKTLDSSQCPIACESRKPSSKSR